MDLIDQAKVVENENAQIAHNQLFDPQYQATIREINRGSNRETRA